jgi:hypothetical protein
VTSTRAKRARGGRIHASFAVSAGAGAAGVAAVALALVAAAAARPARAQIESPGDRSTYELGVAGAFREGSFAPIIVDLEHSGPALSAEARFETPGRTVRLPLRLAGGDRKRLVLYSDRFRAASMAVGLSDGTLLDRIRPAHGQRERHGSRGVALVVARPENHHNPDGPGDATTGSIAQAAGIPPDVVFLTAAQLPDLWVGLEIAELIVVGDDELERVGSRKLSALLHWTLLGGTLVVTGGANPGRLLPTPLAEALPVRLTGQTRRVTSLACFHQEMRESGVERDPAPVRALSPFPVPEASLRPGARPVLQEGEIAIAAARTYGQGTVAYLALDPTAAPGALADPWVRSLVWRSLLPPPRRRPAEKRYRWRVEPKDRPTIYGDGRYDSFEVVRGLGLDDGAARVAWPIAVFGLLYVLVVGPLQYLLLARVNRIHLVWVTTPALALAFSVGAFGVGYARRGGQSIARQLAVIAGDSGAAWAACDVFTRIFAFPEKAYTVTAPAEPYVTMLADAREDEHATLRVQEAAVYVEAAHIDMWADRVFRTRAMVKAPVRIDSDLSLVDGSHFVGRIANRSPFPLQGAALVAGSTLAPLGTIAPGASLPVRAVASTAFVDRIRRPSRSLDLAALASGEAAWLAMGRAGPAARVELVAAVPGLDPFGGAGRVRRDRPMLAIDPPVDRAESAVIIVWRLPCARRGRVSVAVRTGTTRFSTRTVPDLAGAALKLSGTQRVTAQLFRVKRPAFTPTRLVLYTRESHPAANFRLLNRRTGLHDPVPPPSRWVWGEEVNFEGRYASDVQSPDDYVRGPLGIVEMEIEATGRSGLPAHPSPPPDPVTLQGLDLTVEGFEESRGEDESAREATE